MRGAYDFFVGETNIDVGLTVCFESTTKVGEGGITVDMVVIGVVKGWLLNLLLPSSQLLGLPSWLTPMVLSLVALRQ